MPARLRVSFAAMGTYASLLRWLGPWSNVQDRPRDVARRSITVHSGARSFESWVLAPKSRPPSGAFLVAPGLHYEGPADPRFLKFIEALAASGILVHAPFLPDYLALRVEPTVIDDLDAAFAALSADEALPKNIKPGVFSISFGSLPALRLAASEKRRKEVGAVVVFGGYADFASTIRFAVGAGEHAINTKRDPLNQPVVLMNVVDDLPARAEDRPLLLEAWRSFVTQTWARPELKERAKYEPIAQKIAAELPPEARMLFEQGVGIQPGALQLVEAALDKQMAKKALLDPRPHLGQLECPVYLCHGLDDDVIPHTEQALLRAALPAHVEAHSFLTGLYHHTGANPISGLRAMIKEGTTLIDILRAFVRASRMPAGRDNASG